MRQGYEILKNKIGQSLTDGIIQSYYYNGRLADKINVTFLKFDNWLHITTTDFIAILEVDNVEQIESWTDENNSTAEFPLIKIEQEYPDFKNYLGKTLIGFNELTLQKFDEICGIKLYFYGGETLIMYSDDNENSYIIFDNNLPKDLKEKKDH